jgi:hypothetical protein
MFQRPLVDGPQQERCTPDPVGKRRAIEMDALAGVDLRLAIERQVVGILGDEDVGDGRHGGPAALDQPCRRRRLDDNALAARQP